MTPQVFKDDEDVKTTKNSLKIAETLRNRKMPGPESSTVEKNKVKPPVPYPELDSDDEEDDTVETRKSIKTAEKQLKHRFFINARDREDYESRLKAGAISPAEAAFQEPDNQEIGQDPKEAAAKLQVKKEKALAKAAEEEAKKEEAKKPAAQKKAEAKAKAEEEKVAAAKAETPEEKVAAKAPAAGGDPKAAFVPPELKGAMIEMF